MGKEKDKEKETAKEVVEEVKAETTAEAKKEAPKAGFDCKAFLDKQVCGFKVLHILCALCVLVLVVLALSCCGGGKDISYPLVYKTSEGDIMLLNEKGKEKDAVKLASEGSVNVKYANTTNRYLIFRKNGSLYLYDAKAKEETSKIVSDASTAYWTPNDKYIIALDDNNTLYSVVPGKEKEKLESEVSDIVGYTDDKIVYKKDDNLYIRSLKAKKDDRKKIVSDYRSAAFELDGKVVIYVDDENNLYSYSVSKDKAEKISKDVEDFTCGEDSCAKVLYSVVEDEDMDVYIYNGKKSTKILKETAELEDFDLENELFLYTKDGVLYFQKGDKDPYKIGEDIAGASFLGSEAVYYKNDDADLYIAKISGKKLKTAKKLAEDVQGSVIPMDGKLAFVTDLDDNKCGDLYIATTSKAKKIDSDVYRSVSPNKDGSILYYTKNYDGTSGDFYYTKGGKGKKIDTDVHSVTYIKDDLIYYLKDYSSSKSRGDLYRYTGSKGKKVAESVQYMSQPPVEKEY